MRATLGNEMKYFRKRAAKKKEYNSKKTLFIERHQILLKMNSIYHYSMMVWRNIAAQCLRAKLWNQPTFPVDKWIHNMVHVGTMELHTAVKMNAITSFA